MYLPCDTQPIQELRADAKTRTMDNLHPPIIKLGTVPTQRVAQGDERRKKDEETTSKTNTELQTMVTHPLMTHVKCRHTSKDAKRTVNHSVSNNMKEFLKDTL